MTDYDVTKNQAAAMTALIKSCLSNMGGVNLQDLRDDPFIWVDTSDLEEAGWGQKEAEGTFGSLVAKGLIYMDDGFALTPNWDELSKFHM